MRAQWQMAIFLMDPPRVLDGGDNLAADRPHVERSYDVVDRTRSRVARRAQ